MNVLVRIPKCTECVNLCGVFVISAIANTFDTNPIYVQNANEIIKNP